MAKNFYLINNQNPDELPIKSLFQNKLDELGFIENLFGDDKMEILEEKTNQKLTILGLDNERIKGLWKVNLEMEIAGISSKNTSKTVECALLVLTHQQGHAIYQLHIILIELKQTLIDLEIKNHNLIEPSKLQQCEGYNKGGKFYTGKFPASMNRLYMLLSLNEHRNDKNYQNLTIKINFRGVIVYQKNLMTKDDGTQIYQFLNNGEQGKVMNCKTILTDKDKIQVYFFNKNFINISDLGI